VSELRQASAQADGDSGDRVQGWRLVQDRQPARAEGRRREQARRRIERRCAEASGGREAGERCEAGDRCEARSWNEERRIEGGRRILTIARRVVGGFLVDDGPFLAGAIAYQIFFALIPLLALIIGIFGFVYGTQEAELELARIVAGLLPAATGQETKLVGQLVQGRALSLSLGLVGTLLTVTAILGSIDTAMSHILGREGRRAFVRERLNSMLFVVLVFVLAVASFAVSFGVQILATALTDTGLRGTLPAGRARLAARRTGVRVLVLLPRVPVRAAPGRGASSRPPGGAGISRALGGRQGRVRLPHARARDLRGVRRARVRCRTIDLDLRDCGPSSSSERRS